MEGNTSSHAGNTYNIDWYRNGVMFATTTKPNNISYTKAAGTDTIIAVVYDTSKICFRPDTSNAKIVIATISSTSDIITEDGISVYPNPFGDELSINGIKKGDHILLMDATGRALIQKDAEKDKEVIDTKELSVGYYIIKLIAKDGRIKGNVPLMKR